MLVSLITGGVAENKLLKETLRFVKKSVSWQNAMQAIALVYDTLRTNLFHGQKHVAKKRNDRFLWYS